MRRIVVLIFFVLILVEIAGFVLVGDAIGVLPTLGLVLLSMVLGVAMMRRQGFGVMSRMREEIAGGRSPGRELAHGLMILLAGILLLIPGFVSDIGGLLLFVPPVRDFVWRRLRGRLEFMPHFRSADGGFARPGGRQPRQVIDLDHDDYSTAPRRPTPWKEPADD